jgi:hypothetical protein
LGNILLILDHDRTIEDLEDKLEQKSTMLMRWTSIRAYFITATLSESKSRELASDEPSQCVGGASLDDDGSGKSGEAPIFLIT